MVRTSSRTRNRQGDGALLRDDILAAASRILETTGSDDAVTLRAVAREAGITAPAIYAHFADRDAIRKTVIGETFTELARVLTESVAEVTDPVDGLRTVCRAYLDFAAGRPNHYRLLFERHRTGGDSGPAAPDVHSIIGADAFAAFLHAAAACIDAGVSRATDATSAATRVWVGVHGQATLRSSLPWFPWPDRDEFSDDMLRRLADLT